MKSAVLMSMLIISSLAASVLISTSVVNAIRNYLQIDNAVIQTDGSLSAKLKTHGIIPTNGQGGAFGYGIITKEGLNAVIITTTHAGVKDSELQKNKNDPVWHNHFVKLDKHVSGLCGNNPEVVDITFQSPGNVDIQDSKAILSDIPKKFSGTDALTHDKLTLAPGNDVQNVVSFKLDPKFQDGNVKAVCVENITPAKHISNE
jgi:hypothetical protein